MWPGVLLAMALSGADASALLRGVLLEWEGDARAGEFSVRAADHRVHVFLFDERTVFEREGRRTRASALARGDVIEVAYDAEDSALRRYARAVVVTAPAKPRPAIVPWSRPSLTEPGSLFARGQYALAGVIAQVHADRVHLRTRRGGEQVILLREDTRLTGDGLPAERSALQVNMRVFIRAGRTWEGDLEAFEVVWGRILRAR